MTPFDYVCLGIALLAVGFLWIKEQDYKDLKRKHKILLELFIQRLPEPK